MNKPLPLPSTGFAPPASDAAGRSEFRAAEAAGHPTPESIGFEIGVILALTLAIACAVSFALEVYGIE